MSAHDLEKINDLKLGEVHEFTGTIYCAVPGGWLVKTPYTATAVFVPKTPEEKIHLREGLYEAVIDMIKSEIWGAEFMVSRQGCFWQVQVNQGDCHAIDGHTGLHAAAALEQRFIREGFFFRFFIGRDDYPVFDDPDAVSYKDYEFHHD